MSRADLLERLLADLLHGCHDAVVAAAKALLELGEFGQPAGTYPLRGAKSALSTGRLADAVILLHHALRVAEPNTPVWTELMVNRATACAHHGFYRDAIAAGQTVLRMAEALPAETAKFAPFAHHAIGFAYDKLKDYGNAIFHYRLAVDLYLDPFRRAVAASDLAYALVLNGQLDEADLVLTQVADGDDPFPSFVKACTTALVRYHQQRFDAAVAAAESAETLSLGKEDLWAAPLAELWYWHSKATWELGDRHQASTLALRSALSAQQLRLYDLRDTANEWLAEILDKGGIHSA